MSNEKSTIGENIKKYRKENGLSQDKLARLADIAHATIIKIESGRIPSPTTDTAPKIHNWGQHKKIPKQARYFSRCLIKKGKFGFSYYC